MKFMYAIARYPGSVVLPIATYFAIGIKYAFCPETKEKRKYLGFSKRCSVANLILNIIMQAFMYILLMASLQSENNDKHHSIGFLTVFFLALAFNITYLSLDQPCCCSSSQECYCTFCCGPKCFIQDVQVIDLQYDEKIIIRLNWNCFPQYIIVHLLFKLKWIGMHIHCGSWNIRYILLIRNEENDNIYNAWQRYFLPLHVAYILCLSNLYGKVIYHLIFTSRHVNIFKEIHI